MIEPTAGRFPAIIRTNVKQSDNTLVVGLGPTGFTQIHLLLNISTGTIIGSDIVDARLKPGKKLGADETVNALTEEVPSHVRKMAKDGVDLAVVSTGNEKALCQAFNSVRRGGRILLFGSPFQRASYMLHVIE